MGLRYQLMLFLRGGPIVNTYRLVILTLTVGDRFRNRKSVIEIVQRMKCVIECGVCGLRLSSSTLRANKEPLILFFFLRVGVRFQGPSSLLHQVAGILVTKFGLMALVP